MLESILDKISRQGELTRDEAQELLGIENGSREYYELLGYANKFSRTQFSGGGNVYAQIGMDSRLCSVNCKFCSLAKDAQHQNSGEKSLDEVVAYAQSLIDAGIGELFMMTTADYDKEQFLRYAAEVKKLMPPGMRFVANIGDFDLAFAKRLKATGFTGVYHICRLREGVDTEVQPQTRVKTLDSVRDAGLELYYCVEPIGAEHEPSELVDEMFRAKDYPVGVMAVMKRVTVEDGRMAGRGEISAATLAKIAAVCVLTVKPPRAMGVHEPDELCLMAGANQIYAEVGLNPRDVGDATEVNRGFSVADAKRLLKNTDWSV